MEPQKLVEIMNVAERLKDTVRHCYTSGGRRESVAEHSWRTALMAYFVSVEFPDADLEKLLKMCLIHDLGEAFTGDIPTFEKTEEDEKKEEKILEKWLMSLPKPFNREMTELFQEMSERKSLEAKIFKALDNLEALIQHNESDIHTWIPLEYSLQMTYGNDKAEFSDYMKNLRDEVRKDSSVPAIYFRISRSISSEDLRTLCRDVLRLSPSHERCHGSRQGWLLSHVLQGRICLR